MDATRTEARQLAEEGLIEICQKGKAVDPRTFRGIVRLKLLGSKMQEGTQVALSKVKEELNASRRHARCGRWTPTHETFNRRR